MNAVATPQPLPARAGYKVYALDAVPNPRSSSYRHDYYQVNLLLGHCAVQCQGRWLELDGAHLLFAPPRLAYTTAVLSVQFEGYGCLFTPEFLQGAAPATDLPATLPLGQLFAPGGALACALTPAQAAHCATTFQKMLAEQGAAYRFRDDLLRSYLWLLLHDGLRLQPADRQRPRSENLRETW